MLYSNRTFSIPATVGVLALLSLAPAYAQLRVSNLGNSQNDRYFLASPITISSTLFAARFTTDGASPQFPLYSVNGATALLSNQDTSASAEPALYEASIWSDNGANNPGVQLGVFDNFPTLPPDQGPTEVSFVDTGIGLSPNTSYWLAIRNLTTSGPGAPDVMLKWISTSDNSETGTWTIADQRVHSKAASDPWAPVLFDRGVPMFSISAAAVPEGGAYGMIGGLAFLGLVGYRRWRKRA